MTEIAAAYIRCSTDRQEDSPAVQRAIIEQHCAANNLTVPADLWIIDFAESAGKPTHKRPGGAKLLALVRDKAKRPFTKVVIVRADRAFRDTHDQEDVFRFLAANGCEFVGAKQDLSRDTAHARFMLTVLGAANQFEREITGERTKEHNLARHANRLNVGGTTSLGFRVNPDSDCPLIIDPDGLQRAARAMEVYLETGGNLNATCRRLNTEGTLPPRGGHWSPHPLRHLLGAPLYRRQQSYDGRLVDKPDIIPASIDSDTLARVDALLTAQYGHWHVRTAAATKAHRYHNRSTYNGLLACGRCGQLLHVHTTTSPMPGAWAARFVCRSKVLSYRSIEPQCGLPSLHAPTVDRMVSDLLRAALTAVTGLQGATAARRPQRQPADAVAKLQALDEKRERVLSLYVDGLIDMAAYNREMSRLSDQAKALQVSTDRAPDPPLSPQTVAGMLENWDTLFVPGSLSSPAKRELLMVGLGIGRAAIVADKVPAVPVTGTVWTVTITAPRLSLSELRAERIGGPLRDL